MSYITVGDLTIHYQEHGAGMPVLFLHGNWASGAWWEILLELLPEGFRGLAPDMRGRGETRGPDSDYRLESLAHDMARFADALELNRFHLVGHSLGAGVAMQLALDHPEHVASLAVIAPPWVDGMPAAANSAERQRMLKANFDMFAMALKALAPTISDDEFWRRLVVEGHEQRLEAALGAIDSLAAWAPGDALHAITCPRLVIGGEQDILITPPVVARAAEALGVAPSLIAGVGHSPNIEAPQIVLELLLDLWKL